MGKQQKKKRKKKSKSQGNASGNTQQATGTVAATDATKDLEKNLIDSSQESDGAQAQSKGPSRNNTYELSDKRPDLWEGDRRLPAPLSQVSHNRVISEESILGAETEIGKAIESANELLLKRGRERTLTCDDVAKHTAYLATQRQALKEHMGSLQKRTKVFHSLIRQQSGIKSSASSGFGSASGHQHRGRNVNRYLASIAALEKQIASTKRDSIRFNLILDQFLSSPAYATMLNSFEKVAQRTPSGHMIVNPSEDSLINGVTNMSFEDLLEQEKQLMREEAKLGTQVL